MDNHKQINKNQINQQINKKVIMIKNDNNNSNNNNNNYYLQYKYIDF